MQLNGLIRSKLKGLSAHIFVFGTERIDEWRTVENRNGMQFLQNRIYIQFPLVLPVFVMRPLQ